MSDESGEGQGQEGEEGMEGGGNLDLALLYATRSKRVD